MWANAFRSQIKHRLWRIRPNIIKVFDIHLKLKFASSMPVLNEWKMLNDNATLTCKQLNNFSYLDKSSYSMDSVAIHHEKVKIFLVDPLFRYYKYVVVSACICATLPAPNEHLTAGTFISQMIMPNRCQFIFHRYRWSHSSIADWSSKQNHVNKRNREYQQT